MSSVQHAFGGTWTDEKLKIVGEYLTAYTKAMQNSGFRLAYVDAFAGTGYRTEKNEKNANEFEFPEFLSPQTQEFLDGSPRIALKVFPRFSKYVFVEKNRKRARELENLRVEFPTHSVEIRQGEANSKIMEFCAEWRNERAVVFLDPYGLEVEWSTIEAIAATQAFDLWILFPIGVAVNRMLTRSGEISPLWRAKLDRIFGTTDWEKYFYKIKKTEDLFGQKEAKEKLADWSIIGDFFNERLRSVFAGVANNPRLLLGPSNNPLYQLCFACGNPNGAPIAIRIAQHILK